MARWIELVVLLACLPPFTLAQSARPYDLTSAKSASGKNTAASSDPAYPLDSFPEFSAVMIGSRAEPGEGSSQGYIYRLGSRMRMEEPAGLGYFITDLEKGETFGMSATTCIHDDHPYIRAIPFYFAGKADAKITRVSAGEEIVDGHSYRVEDITVSSPKLANPEKMRFWEAEDLQGFPVKIKFLIDGHSGPTIRFKNVVLGEQDPTLFIHPMYCHPLPAGPDAAPAQP